LRQQFGLNHELITACKAIKHLYYAMRRPQRTKVFGIGLSRTGTKSLHRALKSLGYRSEHFPAHLLRTMDGMLTLDIEGVRHYEAMTDTVTSVFYRQLDEHFPESKFILTVRDVDAWLRSCAAHFAPMDKEPPSTAADKIRMLRLLAYGRTDFDAASFRTTYLEHIEEVQRYFRGRDNLLVIDVSEGNAWERLCRFLGVESKGEAFPWANRRLS
jgi:hypothetical protein